MKYLKPKYAEEDPDDRNKEKKAKGSHVAKEKRRSQKKADPEQQSDKKAS